MRSDVLHAISESFLHDDSLSIWSEVWLICHVYTVSGKIDPKFICKMAEFQLTEIYTLEQFWIFCYIAKFYQKKY